MTALIAQDPAPAANGADPAAPAAPNLFGGPLPVFIGLFALFYFIVLLPQDRRRRKEAEAKLAAVKRGSKVVTASGIVGVVVRSEPGEDEVVIRSEDARIRVLRSTITRVTEEADAATPATDAKAS